MSDENVQELVCLSCACTFPYVATQRRHHIKWAKPLARTGAGNKEKTFFLNMELKTARDHWSKDAYLKNYSEIAGQQGKLSESPWAKELMHDTVQLQADGEALYVGQQLLQMLCCPEDVRCTQQAGHLKEYDNVICEHCEAPLCRHCANSVEAQPSKLPEIALASDMWTGSAGWFTNYKT